jgi:hypothetical protein
MKVCLTLDGVCIIHPRSRCGLHPFLLSAPPQARVSCRRDREHHPPREEGEGMASREGVGERNGRAGSRGPVDLSPSLWLDLGWLVAGLYTHKATRSISCGNGPALRGWERRQEGCVRGVHDELDVESEIGGGVRRRRMRRENRCGRAEWPRSHWDG